MFFQQHHRYFGILAFALGVGLAVQQYYLSKRFAEQLVRLERRSGKSEAVRRYLHQWWICKRPSVCARCRGWLGGLISGTAGWIVAYVIFDVDPLTLVREIGLAPTFVLAVAFLFLTPLHGMFGRLGKFASTSVWEMKAVLEAVGALSALSAPLLATIAYMVWSSSG